MKKHNPEDATFSLGNTGISLRLCSDEKRAFIKMHFNIPLHVYFCVFIEYLYVISISILFIIVLNFDI